MVRLSASSRKGFPASRSRGAWRPFGVGGARCRRPPAKSWAPFARGCAPKGSDHSHENGQVEIAVAAEGSTPARPLQSAHGWRLSLPPEAIGLRRPVPSRHSSSDPTARRPPGGFPPEPDQEQRHGAYPIGIRQRVQRHRSRQPHLEAARKATGGSLAARLHIDRTVIRRLRAPRLAARPDRDITPLSWRLIYRLRS